MKRKCKYCETKIESVKIRCHKCDLAWQEGFEAGKREIKSKLSEIFDTIKNLTNQ